MDGKGRYHKIEDFSVEIIWGLIHVKGIRQVFCGWLALPCATLILDFLIHYLGHEFAYRIRSFRSDSNGDLLRVGAASHFFHSRIRILMRSWVYLRLSARCVAFRCGRTDLVGNCCEKVVDRSKIRKPTETVDEGNSNVLAVNA